MYVRLKAVKLFSNEHVTKASHFKVNLKASLSTIN